MFFEVDGICYDSSSVPMYMMNMFSIKEENHTSRCCCAEAMVSDHCNLDVEKWILKTHSIPDVEWDPTIRF